MRRKRKIMVLAICVVWGLILWPTPGQATLITIEIEAVVDSVSDEGNYLEGKIKVGDIITGFYSYDSSTPDTNPSPTVGHYWHYDTPAGISLTVRGWNFQTDPANVEFLIGVGNDGPSGNDLYWLASYNNASLDNGALVDSIWWQLNDNTGSALSSDALPTTFPFLGDWQADVLGIEADRRYAISAHVSSAIPEPCTIVFLGLGGFVLRKRS